MRVTALSHAGCNAHSGGLDLNTSMQELNLAPQMALTSCTGLAKALYLYDCLSLVQEWVLLLLSTAMHAAAQACLLDRLDSSVLVATHCTSAGSDKLQRACHTPSHWFAPITSLGG